MTEEEMKLLETPQILRTVVENDNPDTAFEKWEYKPVIIKLPEKRSWFNLGGTFYRASYAIIEGIVKGNLFEEIEGPAGVYLFRHFLELSMKEIILWGRSLKTQDENAIWENIEQEWGHKLLDLWQAVRKDAKPKIDAARWDSLDIAFVEKRVAEFAKADPGSTTFRYEGAGGENLEIDYKQLLKDMPHVRMVLEHIANYLRYMRIRNDDWEEMQAENADIFFNNAG